MNGPAVEEGPAHSQLALSTLSVDPALAGVLETH